MNLGLTKDTEERAKEVINYCEKIGGFTLLIYFGERTLEEQACFYRQSRTKSTIDFKINTLRKSGYGYLADILLNTPPCYGAKVTSAAPGETWHNYGEAFDSVPVLNNKACWDIEIYSELWQCYGEAIKSTGMTWGGDWIGFKDYPHAQLRSVSNPLYVYNPEQAKELLISNGLLK